MSATQPAPVAPAPDPGGRVELPPPTAAAPQRRPGLRDLLGKGTTPQVLRRWSLLVAGACVLAALVANASTAAFSTSTRTIRDNTGPVLVTTQNLLASLAEADAAATAAFLTGQDEDPIARRAYLDALGRATDQLEDVSALIGDDPETHEALKDVAHSITRYVGLVESARATNLAGLPVGEDYLVDAVGVLAGDLTQASNRLGEATTQRLEEDARALQTRGTAAMVVLAVALALLVVGQVRLARRTRRLINIPIAVATLLVLVSTIWSIAAIGSANVIFANARDDGFDAIETTARVQTAGFGAKGAETVALITGDTAARTRADQLITDVSSTGGTSEGLLAELALAADTEREAARVEEAAVRWSRYLESVSVLRSAGSDAQAVAVAVGPLSADFNGFNFAVEGILADNRDQFLDGLDAASRRAAPLPPLTLLAPLLAAVLALLGYQQRIGEYR